MPELPTQLSILTRHNAYGGRSLKGKERQTVLKGMKKRRKVKTVKTYILTQALSVILSSS